MNYQRHQPWFDGVRGIKTRWIHLTLLRFDSTVAPSGCWCLLSSSSCKWRAGSGLFHEWLVFDSTERFGGGEAIWTIESDGLKWLKLDWRLKEQWTTCCDQPYLASLQPCDLLWMGAISRNLAIFFFHVPQEHRICWEKLKKCVNQSRSAGKWTSLNVKSIQWQQDNIYIYI